MSASVQSNLSKEKLAAALKILVRKEPLRYITTEEIAKAASTSRQTFYRYFDDKYDLAFWCYQRDVEPIHDNFLSGKISFHDMNVEILELLKSDSKFYKNVFKNFEVQGSFFQHYKQFSFDTALKAIGRVPNSDIIRGVIEIWSLGCNMKTLDWVTGSMKEDIEFMASIYDASLPSAVRNWAD